MLMLRASAMECKAWGGGRPSSALVRVGALQKRLDHLVNHGLRQPPQAHDPLGVLGSLSPVQQLRRPGGQIGGAGRDDPDRAEEGGLRAILL